MSSTNFGMIGLGRMGANIVRRLANHHIASVVYDVSPDSVAALAAEGSIGSTDLADFAAKLTAPRTVWVMVPAGVTDSTAQSIDAMTPGKIGKPLDDFCQSRPSNRLAAPSTGSFANLQHNSV